MNCCYCLSSIDSSTPVPSYSFFFLHQSIFNIILLLHNLSNQYTVKICAFFRKLYLFYKIVCLHVNHAKCNLMKFGWKISMKILLQIVSLFNCVLNGLVFIQIFSFLFFWKSLKTFQFRIIRILFPDRTTV